MKKLKNKITYRVPEILFALGFGVIALAGYNAIKNPGTDNVSAFLIGVLGFAVMALAVGMIDRRGVSSKNVRRNGRWRITK